MRAQPVPFLLNILKWLLVAIPATWTNSWLSYVQSKLALAYRTRLTKEILGEYLGDEEQNDKVFYKLGASTFFQRLITPLTERPYKLYSEFGRPYKES